MANFIPARRILTLAAMALAASAPFLSAQSLTRADAEKDPVLKAMLTELDRSQAQLKLKDFEKPYFIEYRIDEISGFGTRAEYGALQSSGQFHRRGALVNVRIGSYKSDNSGRGDSVPTLEVLDNDPIALRTALWTATDQAYKAALDAYARKQAELKQVQTPPQADDFSHEKPVILLQDPKSFSIDQTTWERAIQAASGLFLSDPSLAAARPDVQYARAYLDATAVTSWLVNSEGTITRTSVTHYDLGFSTGGQAADGMKLDRSYYLAGNSPADLDTPENLTQHALACFKGLEELRQAPLVDEEYHGPVLLAADAAAGALKGLLARAVTASRPPLGTEARTTGALASSLHARVLPDFIDVTDDPSLATWNGKGNAGTYSVDSQGVPAQTVPLVVSGKLENYLLSREPIRDFPNSNGHGRAAPFAAALPSIGVLRISAHDGESLDSLNQKLLAMAKDRGLSNVYFVESISGSGPRLLYKLAQDGKRTLVRGARLEDLDLRTLRSGIVAAGKDLFANNQLGGQPNTVLAPALLFDDITVKRANEKNDKLPYYPPPS